METAMAEREEREKDEQMQDNGTNELSPAKNGDLVEEKLTALVKNDDADFGAWTSLISEIENTSLNDLESIRKVYDAFLLEFPLCCGYWKKYASHVARCCDLNEVEKVYGRAVKAMPYSVDIWVSYCSFARLAYEDPLDVRRLFDRGLSLVGKDYSSHLLWDKYIEFEHSQKQWNCLAYIYLNTLRFPTKKLIHYYMSFKKLVAIWEEEIGYEKNTTVQNGSCEDTNVKTCKHAEILNVISNLFDIHGGFPKPSLVKKYLLVGELWFEKSSQIDEKINSYEHGIRRPHFHVKPLDDRQLENWHKYLDFVEMQGDFDWTVKLYERCLIPCANYSEFWIRYVEFAEAKGGREIANHALKRAHKLFFKSVPAFRLYCSMFKEKTGDIDGARAPFLRPDVELNIEFIENVTREANMEKRMGRTESACMVYEKAIDLAKSKQNLQILSILYNTFARFTFVVSNDIDAAIEVFLRGIQEVPCKSIIQEMISFITVHGGPGQIPKLDANISNIIAPVSVLSQALNSHDREEISSLFLEFVDLYGTIHEVRKAWDRHRKLFPHIMKCTANYLGTPFRDNHLVNEAVGEVQKLVPGSHQACGNDGHNGSRTHVLDHKSPENDNHVPVEGRAPGKLQDHIIDNVVMEELDEVAEDVEKHSLNDAEGREGQMEVAEAAGKHSANDNIERDELNEVAEDVEKRSVYDTKGIEGRMVIAKDVGNHSANDHKEREELNEVAEYMEKHSVNDTKGREGLMEVAENLRKHSVNDNMERDELDEVAEDVDTHSVSETKGRDGLLEVAEDAGKLFINDNMAKEELEENTEDVGEQSIRDNKGGEELVKVAEDVEMQLLPEGTEICDKAIVSAHEDQNLAQVPEATPEYPKVGNQIQCDSEKEFENDSRPPALTLSINNPDNVSQQSKPTTSHDPNTSQEAISGAGENVLVDEGNSDELSAIHVSDPKDTKLSTPSQVDGNNSPLHSVCDSTPPESRSNPQLQTQAHAQTTLQHDLPVNVAYSQNASSTGNWPQMYYMHASQSQQWHGQTQVTPAVTTNSQMTAAQGYPYQSQSWTGTADQQQVNQTYNQYQMATAQVYPIGTLTWPGQNVQQQAYAYVQPQSGTQPQPQVSQHSLQSNEQQYGYVQNSQGIPPNMWQYYQQQYYYLQQQQQQNQQTHGNYQQEQMIDQVQQGNPQPQPNQQISGHQQQQIPNQQVSSQQHQHLHNQQISSQQEQQRNQNPEASQLLHQHQFSQCLHQNQQVHNTQQYQQLLYMQQQQQQQLYLQQQQQYYLQQQQLVQQQQFQQLSHQEQQLLLQQQQQLFQQQQQQQLLQLQQQHHQQIQQLQQQSVQQQQQQQYQQPVQWQQQTSASASKALSPSYSQGEGDDLQNGGLSGTSVSPHPHSPANR